MTTSQLYRASGLALLLGAIVAGVATALDGLLFPSNDAATVMNPLNVTLNALGVVGVIVLLLGLPGVYVRSAAAGGLLWLVGVVFIAITGVLLGVFMGLVSTLMFPAIAAQAPSLLNDGPPQGFIVIFVLATLTNIVGALGMGIPILSRRLYPRWCGYLMILEAVLAAVSFVLQGPSVSLVATILNVLSPVPLLVVLGYAGWGLWIERTPGVQERLVEAAPATAY